MWLVLISLILSFLLIISYFKYQFRYWKVRNVPYAEPEIPFGNCRDHVLQILSIRETISKVLKKYKKCDTPYFGVFFFTKPLLLILSPELVKKIFVEDFEHFNQRIFYYHEKNDPISANIFFLGGDQWKFIRQKVSPTFTSSRLKTMFHKIVSCGKGIEEQLLKYENGDTFEIRDLMSRYLVDIIAYCAYGFEPDSLRFPHNEFHKQAERIKNRSLGDVIRGFISFASPTLMTLLKLRVIPHEPADFFLKTIKDSVAYREKHNIVRNDFLHLLIQLKNKGHLDGEKDGDGRKLTIEQIAAHSFMFYLAGFETSSITITSFIYETSKHPEVQKRVRDEIHEVLKKYNGEITYEGIKEMTYLRQTIDETLRLHPISEFLTRRCTKKYKFPDSDLVLDEGFFVIVPVIDIHKNPKYFPDPDVFDPDRFSPERKDEIIPYSFIPFGHGPRYCLGMRLAYIQMKVAIISLLKNYRFTINPKTREPLKQVPSTFLSDFEGGVWVNIERIH